MQKMANAVKRPQYAKIMDAYKDEKVVFIIDECHRSQFGDMHKAVSYTHLDVYKRQIQRISDEPPVCQIHAHFLQGSA